MCRKIIISFNLLLLIAIPLNSQPNFMSPLGFPLSLSANFGELRSDHYHSGIDIKTQGVTGKEVVSADSGYVYLLLVSPVGFGRAIFVRHPSGYSTVYGHLESFAPEIQEYVKNQQYRNKSFSVTVYPPKERFPVSRGQLLGYSGNSGSSSGPHLHFEVRKSDTEKPVNPEKFNFRIEDNIKPVIERLVVYPSARGTIINGRPGKLFLGVNGGDGHYELQQQISIHGTAGFGITSYDHMNDTQNRFGINYIELRIDSIPWFSYDLNEFSFSETRYINAHIDYEESVKRNIDIEKLFVMPNDKLSLYKTYMNSGLFDFSDGKVHKVSITVKDGKGNATNLSFKVYPGIDLQDFYPQPADSTVIVMPFGKENVFSADGVKVKIPAGALYDTLYFTYKSTPGHDNLFSPVHHIGDRFTPVQKQITVSIRPDSVPEDKSSRLLLVQIDEKGLVTSAGGKYSDGYVTGLQYSMGNFAVGIDTIPPTINANGLNNNPDYTGKNEIRFRIRDDFSGIRSYEGMIDGKWALFEYDSKNDLLVYRFDAKRLSKGTKHTLTLTVSDNCDNIARITRDFTW